MKTVTVHKEGILLEKTSRKFENHGVFNPACIRSPEGLHLFYRATSKGNFSSIGYCRLASPTRVEKRNTSPLLVPRESYESHGMEDPRLTEIEGTYFLTYTAYDGHNALGALATSTDLKHFERQGLITPQLTYREYQLCVECCEGISDKYLRFVKMFYERGGAETIYKLLVWDKDVVMFPKKINGKYALLHRLYPGVQIAYFNDLADLTPGFWKEHLFHLDRHTILEGKWPFEASHVGAGCPPLETEAGWLLIYHGVQDTHLGYVYHACAALMSLEDPSREIGRLPYPLFSPELPWEKTGVVNNVVFPTGTLLEGDTLYIYYGAADRCIGVARLSLSELIQAICSS